MEAHAEERFSTLSKSLRKEVEEWKMQCDLAQKTARV
jgi:hypothetical protein